MLDFLTARSIEPPYDASDLLDEEIECIMRFRRLIAKETPGTVAEAAHAARELALIIEAGEPGDPEDDVALELARNLAAGLEALARP